MNIRTDRQSIAEQVYQAPTLKVFGNVVTLTASGSGPQKEARTGTSGSVANCGTGTSNQKAICFG